MNKAMNKGAFGKGAKTLGGKSTGISMAGGKPRSKKEAPPSPPIKAMSLLGRWTRMAQGHIAFGGGCSCAGGVCDLQVQDMEQHILDYLATKYRAAKVEGVSKLLAERASYRSGEAGSIAELLRAVAMQSEVPLTPEQQTSLLADLERSIDSLDEMSGGAGV